jgi:hypothetical protein
LLKNNVGAIPQAAALAIPALPRVAAAAVVMAVAARRSLPWLVPVAATMADPIFWPTSLCLLLAIPRAANLGFSRGWFADGPLGLLSLRLPLRRVQPASE